MRRNTGRRKSIEKKLMRNRIKGLTEIKEDSTDRVV